MSGIFFSIRLMLLLFGFGVRVAVYLLIEQIYRHSRPLLGATTLLFFISITFTAIFFKQTFSSSSQITSFFTAISSQDITKNYLQNNTPLAAFITKTPLPDQTQLQKQQLQTQLDHYLLIIETQPPQADILINAALLATELEQTQLAQTLFDKAQTIEPKHPHFK